MKVESESESERESYKSPEDKKYSHTATRARARRHAPVGGWVCLLVAWLAGTPPLSPVMRSFVIVLSFDAGS